jgi:putative intracellular protease/amidase
MEDSANNPVSRRFALGAGAALSLSGATAGSIPAPAIAAGAEVEPAVVYGSKPRPTRHDGPLSIGSLVFPRMDQIDFTGPFEVFARIPDTIVHVIAKTNDPMRDVKGLALTPTMSISEAPEFDVLAVAGGLGQQALMDDEEIMSLIRRHINAGRLVFSVCTGALLCGAAGVLKGRQATTHWAALDLLKFYGASPVKSRVVVDGNYISTAGVTAGLDGGFLLHHSSAALRWPRKFSLTSNMRRIRSFMAVRPSRLGTASSMRSSRSTEQTSRLERPRRAVLRRSLVSESTRVDARLRLHATRRPCSVRFLPRLLPPPQVPRTPGDLAPARRAQGYECNAISNR